MSPEEFIKSGPQKPEDLIGKARSVAQVFCARARSGVVSPIKALFYGSQGIGKSAVCKIIANHLVDHPIMLRHLSAKQITAEMIRDWMRDLQYKNDQWRVFWIEEVDAVNPDVEVLLLQFLDELPDKNAFLATSNEQMSGISPRFQSRCQAVKFEKPAVDEVEKFLLHHWSKLGKKVAHEIAESNGGDVRASLNDAQGALDMEKYGVKA